MFNKYSAIANTNENGLIRGKEYIVESNSNGTVNVYNTEGVYLMLHRLDSFDNWALIQ